MEFQAEDGVAQEYSAFNRDKDKVLRRGVVEVPSLLESGRPFLGPDTKGDTQTSEDGSVIKKA
jgi:hypothetical protein